MVRDACISNIFHNRENVCVCVCFEKDMQHLQRQQVFVGGGNVQDVYSGCVVSAGHGVTSTNNGPGSDGADHKTIAPASQMSTHTSKFTIY